MTHKERLLLAAQGELADVLPYAPRFDLWYNANRYRGTLPREHRDRTADQIARAEGWALHKVIPELLKVDSPEENVARCLGLYSLKENGYRVRFSANVDLRVERSGDATTVEYHTPKGVIRTSETLTEEMKRAGASITWVQERALQKVEDYEVLAYIFENLSIEPDYARYAAWQREIGEDGLAVMMGTFSASPIHHIQRDFLEATEFFYEYEDHYRQMKRLAEAMEGVYDQILKVVADSPAEVVLWGANYDDMITYPPYFEREMLPWLKKASAYLESKGKLMICHCDGENLGLMDLLPAAGFHIAEALCPAPMTKVPLEEYYRRWGDKLTILGGVPQSLLLEATASAEEFEAYLDRFFQAVAPGRRVIVGIADTTPPDAVFDRLRRLGDRIEREGRLPLAAGGFRPAGLGHSQGPATAGTAAAPLEDQTLAQIQVDVLSGDQAAILAHVKAALAAGFAAQEILTQGMISAMEIIGGRFRTGEVFIPEVLLSARAMNEALLVLEPHLAGERRGDSGRILLGTVRGDLHDIGKNMVATMLRGVGYEIKDLGINVANDAFVRAVVEHKPDVLGLSALLTTTMPEMGRVIQALAEAGVRDKVKIIVGGAPVNERFAAAIGADGYAADAGEAVGLVRRLLRRG